MPRRKTNKRKERISLTKQTPNNHEQTNIQIQKQEPKECRICLQEQFQTDKQMRCVCRCQGSVKYVHLDCLKGWIIHSLNKKTETEKNLIQKQGIKCQLCKTPIFFSFTLEYVIDDSGMYQKFSKKKWIFFFVVLLILLMMGAIGYCASIIVTHKEKDLLFVVYISILTLLSVIVFLILLVLFLEFCLKVEYSIGDIKKLIKGRKEKVSILTDHLPLNKNLLIQNLS